MYTLLLAALAHAIPVPADSDGDGIWDSDDNCMFVANPSQTDSDGDGVGDACDVCPGFDDNVDLDGNGVPDGCDGPPDLLPLFPGVAGAYNNWWLERGAPNENAYLVAGTVAGSTPIPGCPGLSVPMADAEAVTWSLTDGGGGAVGVVWIPAAASGQTVGLFVVQPGSCLLSSPEITAFP